MAEYFGLQLPHPPRVSLATSRARLRRLRNEGFNWFLASVLLFAIAMILLRIYYASERALENAIQKEILATVGTPQEPSESTPELGLVAAALGRINGERPPKATVPDGIPCPAGDVMCVMITRLEREFDAATGPSADPSSQPAGDGTGLAQYPVINVVRPEIGDAIHCERAHGMDGTSFLLPVQLHDELDGQSLSPRIRRAIAASSALGDIVARLRRDFGTTDEFALLVQAYFISPDSLLRIWTARGTNVCADFDRFRLWAARSYFTYFWSHPENSSYSTKVYLDYGGNGLVQTRCKAIEKPRPSDSRFQHGFLFGVLCTDSKLSDEYLALLRRNLFFSTALVTYEASPDVPFLDVDTSLPGSQRGAANVPEPIDTPSHSQSGAAEAIQPDLDGAIDLQPVDLDRVEVKRAVGERIARSDLGAISRGPTRVPYRESDAFLLPVGAAPVGACGNKQDIDCRQAVLFHPRNPTLPRWTKALGATGYLALGGAVMLGMVGIGLRPRSEELRERLTLLRNLQVGVVQVDQHDWILEANDRAEELFGRRLPKYQVTHRGIFGAAARRIRRRFHHEDDASPALKVSFDGLIVRRLREMTDGSGGARFVETTADEIATLRASGRWSAYYAQLREGIGRAGVPTRRWLRVSATPMMLAHPSRTRGAQLANIFATVTEVPDAIAAELESIRG